MTALQWALTVLAGLIGLSAIAFAYVVQLANAMKTTAPPLSARDAAIAVAPAVLCAGLLAVEYMIARRAGNVSRALAWNSAAIAGTAIAILMVAAGWATDRPAARRAATARLHAFEENRNAELWQSSGSIPEYELKVERGIQTVLGRGEGKEEPGVDWLINFKVDGRSQTVTVHSFATNGEPIELAQHSRQVLQRLKAMLDGGWRPRAEEPTPIEVIATAHP